MITLLLALLTLLFCLCITLSVIWTVIEIVLYLNEGDPFNWWSVVFLAISIITFTVSYFVTVWYDMKLEQKHRDKIDSQWDTTIAKEQQEQREKHGIVT